MKTAWYSVSALQTNTVSPQFALSFLVFVKYKTFYLPVQLCKGIFIVLSKHPLSCRSIVEIDASRLNNLVEGLFNYRAEPANPREQLREQSANWNLFQGKKSNQ